MNDNKTTIPLEEQKRRLFKYLSSVKPEEIFADKNKRARENLIRAGLI